MENLLLLPNCRLDHVLHKHGDGHRPDAARNRGICVRELVSKRMNIAAKFAVLISIDADINDSCLANIIGNDDIWLADCGNNNIRLFKEIMTISIARLGMKDGYIRIAVKHHTSKGSADKITAAEDNDVFTFNWNKIMVKKTDDAFRSAWTE